MTHKEFSQKGGQSKSKKKRRASRANAEKARAAKALKHATPASGGLEPLIHQLQISDQLVSGDAAI